MHILFSFLTLLLYANGGLNIYCYTELDNTEGNAKDAKELFLVNGAISLSLTTLLILLYLQQYISRGNVILLQVFTGIVCSVLLFLSHDYLYKDREDVVSSFSSAKSTFEDSLNGYEHKNIIDINYITFLCIIFSLLAFISFYAGLSMIEPVKEIQFIKGPRFVPVNKPPQKVAIPPQKVAIPPSTDKIPANSYKKEDYFSVVDEDLKGLGDSNIIIL